MSQFDKLEMPPWVLTRILDFLNRADTPRDITRNPELQDDPGSGSERGYIIGETVARRIIEQRSQLPAGRFTTLEELRDVKGLGDDKIHDLAFSFSTPAAQAFRAMLYAQNILPANWTLTHHTEYFKDQAEFRAVAESQSLFLDWIETQVRQISGQQTSDPSAARLAGELARKCYVDTYTTAHYAALAFAFWCYRFDADNWFSFETIRRPAEKYFSTYPGPDNRLELRLFKDFPNSGVLVAAISARDLPVVINYAESAITIWTGELKD